MSFLSLRFRQACCQVVLSNHHVDIPCKMTGSLHNVSWVAFSYADDELPMMTLAVTKLYKVNCIMVVNERGNLAHGIPSTASYRKRIF